MRYYDIRLTNAAGRQLRQWTSFVDGQTDPGALNIELDVIVSDYATPVQGSGVQIWGVSLQDIGQASDLNGTNVAVYAGMKPGLPLANASQSGLIIQGLVQQAFGNWLGTEQNLNLVITAGQAAGDAPNNLAFQWRAGTSLSSVIDTTLSTAFPGYTRKINISPKLVLAHDEPGFYGSIVQFAKYVREVSRDIVGGTDYPGVSITLKDRVFEIYDGTTKTSPKQIAFVDMIGQPTWIGPATIQVNCVMRADLKLGDYVRLPPTPITNTAQSFSQYRDKSVMQGVFQIVFVRHVGNSRQPDGSAWITTYNLIPSK